MEREIIKLSEFDIKPILCEWALEYDEYDEIFGEDGEIIGHHLFQDFDPIESKSIYHDLEKGYEDIEVIVQRKSDKKFFKGYYSDSPYIGIHNFSEELKQVFPTEMTITVYL